MADKEEKLEYSFEFKCPDFELEFKGDFNFVQNQLRKYEPKILVKLNQLVPGERLPAPQPARPQPHPQPHPHPAPAQKPPYRDDQRKYRDKRRGYKRPGEPDKKDDKKPTREPDFVENRQRVEGGSTSPAIEERKLEMDAQELRSLLDRYHPRTSHDRVMIFAFSLEDKREEFGLGEIQECYQTLGERSPGNLSVVLNNASRSGFLAKEEKAGRARFRLTFKGKRYVENGLRLD